MKKKTNVLFVCQYNSGRSQIAEAYLRYYHGDNFSVESAGLLPAAAVSPLVVQVMKEAGFDLSEKKPVNVFELFKRGNLYSYVITVCHKSEPNCPVFPGITKRWHCPFSDPESVEGTNAEKLEAVRAIRDAIRDWIRIFPETLKHIDAESKE